MGYSQGGLIGRYIAETCDTKYPINNLLTLGGPNMGVEKIPHC
jgi:triacylglycerol esterase/lipase EstA (alpha/beta hydrolase family)